MRAVLANVIKGMEHVAAVADTKETLACNIKTEVVARLRNLGNVAGVLPGTGKKAAALLLVKRLAGVIGRIQGMDNLMLLYRRIAHNLRCFPPSKYQGHTYAGENAQYWQ
jgi:hypothetical protein